MSLLLISLGINLPSEPIEGKAGKVTRKWYLKKVKEKSMGSLRNYIKFSENRRESKEGEYLAK